MRAAVNKSGRDAETRQEQWKREAAERKAEATEQATEGAGSATEGAGDDKQREDGE